MKHRTRNLLCAGAAVIVLMAAGAALGWSRAFPRYTPLDAFRDLRAAIRAQHAPNPTEEFFERRYGPLTDPANRQRVFLDFFNVGHQRGMQIITRHQGSEKEKASIAATAKWIADYRRKLTPQEKQALGAYFRSDTGRARKEESNAEYLKQDAQSRADQAPVFREITFTLLTVGSL
jgi:hypothetical protein